MNDKKLIFSIHLGFLAWGIWLFEEDIPNSELWGEAESIYPSMYWTAVADECTGPPNVPGVCWPQYTHPERLVQVPREEGDHRPLNRLACGVPPQRGAPGQQGICVTKIIRLIYCSFYKQRALFLYNLHIFIARIYHLLYMYMNFSV